MYTVQWKIHCPVLMFLCYQGKILGFPLLFITRKSTAETQPMPVLLTVHIIHILAPQQQKRWAFKNATVGQWGSQLKPFSVQQEARVSFAFNTEICLLHAFNLSCIHVFCVLPVQHHFLLHILWIISCEHLLEAESQICLTMAGDIHSTVQFFYIAVA